MGQFKIEPHADDRFRKTVYVVEGGYYTEHALWVEYHERRSFEIDSHGYLIKVGELQTVEREEPWPVTVSVNWYLIDGQRVLFYHPTSQVVHWGWVKDWIMEQTGPPSWEGGVRRGHTDAMNFNHCLHAIDELNKKKGD
jgi:hypothetical protein